MTDADIFIGRSAPWSSSGIGAFAELLGGVSELWGWRGLGRWLSVVWGFGVGELCGERVGDVGFIVLGLAQRERGKRRELDGIKLEVGS